MNQSNSNTTEQEVRTEAMAAEYRGLIVQLSARCAGLAAELFISKKRVAELDATITVLRKLLDDSSG